MPFINRRNEPEATTQGTAKIENEQDSRVKARERRLAALRRVAGIWADRNDIPTDSIVYERELRDEWR